MGLSFLNLAVKGAIPPNQRAPGKGDHVCMRRESTKSRVSGWTSGAGSRLHHAELSQLRPVQRPACWPLRGTETKAATFCLPSWSWDGSAPDRDPPACEQLRARVTENNKHPLVCRKGGDEKREDVRPLPATHPPRGQAVNPGRAVPPAGLPRWHQW